MKRIFFMTEKSIKQKHSAKTGPGVTSYSMWFPTTENGFWRQNWHPLLLKIFRQVNLKRWMDLQKKALHSFRVEATVIIWALSFLRKSRTSSSVVAAFEVVPWTRYSTHATVLWYRSFLQNSRNSFPQAWTIPSEELHRRSPLSSFFSLLDLHYSNPEYKK